MMNKLRVLWLPTLALIQTGVLVLTLLFSWVGNLYGLPVQNLLANEGIRWMLRHVMSNFAAMPVLTLLLLLMAWGVLKESGWLTVGKLLAHRHFDEVTPKQRWGFQMSMMVGVLFLALLGTGFLGMEPTLLSVTGQLYHSPLVEGAPLIIWVGVLLVAGCYAWIAGRFPKVLDFVGAMSSGVADWGILFVNLFLLGQQIEFMKYILR